MNIPCTSPSRPFARRDKYEIEVKTYWQIRRDLCVVYIYIYMYFQTIKMGQGAIYCVSNLSVNGFNAVFEIGTKLS